VMVASPTMRHHDVGEEEVSSSGGKATSERASDYVSTFRGGGIERMTFLGGGGRRFELLRFSPWRGRRRGFFAGPLAGSLEGPPGVQPGLNRQCRVGRLPGAWPRSDRWLPGRGKIISTFETQAGP